MRTSGFLSIFGAVVFAATLPTLAQRDAAPPARPGYEGNGVTLLPNGWRIAPEGRHVLVGGLPMNLVPSPDGRFIAISTSGWAKPAISIFDTHTLQLVSRAEVDHTWLGLVWHPDGKRLFASGASENVIYEYSFNAGRLRAAGTISLGAAEVHPGGDVIVNAGYVTGMAISADGKRLYATEMYGQRVRAIDIAQKQIAASAELAAEPYTCVLSPDGRTLFVSVWGGAKVVMFDPATLTVKGEIAVGEHPNAI